MIRVVIICLLMSISSIFSQGLNNNKPIDSLDLKMVFNLLGVEIFKFDFDKTNKDVKLKFSILDFIDGKIQDTTYIFDYSYIPKEMRKNYENFLELNDKDIQLRFYSVKQSDSSFMVTYYINYSSTSLEFVKDSAEFIGAWRAYSKYQPKIGEKTPFLIKYAVRANTNMVSCPGDTPIEEVIKMYPFVTIFASEIVEE